MSTDQSDVSRDRVPRDDDSPPEVSVLIVSHNSRSFIEACLEGLSAALGSMRYEVIVADNASTDGTDILLANRRDIRFVRSSLNLGFAGGNRLAASIARGGVLLLLNADTVPALDLGPLIRLAGSAPVGVAGCRLRYPNGRIQPSFGYQHSELAVLLGWCGVERWRHLPRRLRRVETNKHAYTSEHDELGWLSGACMATRREVWDRLGGLDDRYFMYCEDVDYCARVRAAGLRVSFTAQTEVTHLEGSGRPWVGRAALMQTIKSYHVFFGDRNNALTLRTLFLGLAALFIGRSIVYRLMSIGMRPSARGTGVHSDKASAFSAAALVSLCVAAFGSSPAGSE
jgi:GT2 family glycosyltransferase